MAAGPTPAPDPEILSTRKIWDRAPHCAFTDLIKFNETWFVAFREGKCHAGEAGAIRILSSRDKKVWFSAALLRMDDIDLRDPKLSITPENQLMLLAGGVTKDFQRDAYTAFSLGGSDWTPLKKVLANEWLWRVTWHEGSGYGVSYRVEKDHWPVSLFVTKDGVNYEKIKEFDIEGKPSETTLRFKDSGEMVALMRRGSFPFGATLIGVSRFPYQKWSWTDTKMSFGGPNFVILPNGEMRASGRVIQFDENDELVERTTLARMNEQSLSPVIDLPSGGDDTSYPGMVYQDGILWISYYSSHEEGKSAIYLAKIKVE